MSTLEIRERDDCDGSGPSLPFIVPASRLSLAEVLHFASKLGETADVLDGERYLVTYCGESPYWWLPGEHGGDMHQISSHGWCHTCHGDGLGYVHHLDYEVELAVLATEARDDQVLRQMCEADGLTPEQYAAEVAGRAIPADGDHSFAIGVHSLSSDPIAGTATFAIDMLDMTTWRVTVPMIAGAPEAARELAEERAYRAQPKRCHDCKGTRGHSKRCGVTKDREFIEKHPEFADDFPVRDPLESA